MLKINESEIKGFFGEYRWLSNFWCAKFVDHNFYEWKTVEHAYQAAKATTIEDKDLIHQCATAGEAKRLGKKILIRDYWENDKCKIMYMLVKMKFEQNPYLMEKLLATGNAYLEETNTWGDKYYGVCNGIGENWLGKILMEIRKENEHNSSGI